jgi:GR25 family glycosyltransferase involved in LPS biosynthesis
MSQGLAVVPVMKGYVIAVLDIAESAAAAERCVQSGVEHGIDVHVFGATTQACHQIEMESLGLFASDFKTTFANPECVLACFTSHFRVWQQIQNSSEPGIVLEHDAVFISPLPPLESAGDIVNLGRPSYGRFKKKWRRGVYPFFSKRSGRIGGAHAYYVTPSGAEALMSTAKTVGAMPPDLFVSTDRFPGIMEVYPWPAIAQDDFTTIQLANGCQPKHGHSEKYRILTRLEGR